MLTGRIVDALAEKKGVEILVRLILLSLGLLNKVDPDNEGGGMI